MKHLIYIIASLFFCEIADAQTWPYPYVYQHGDSLTLDSNRGGQSVDGVVRWNLYANSDASQFLTVDENGFLFLGQPGTGAPYLRQHQVAFGTDRTNRIGSSGNLTFYGGGLDIGDSSNFGWLGLNPNVSIRFSGYRDSTWRMQYLTPYANGVLSGSALKMLIPNSNAGFTVDNQDFLPVFQVRGDGVVYASTLWIGAYKLPPSHGSAGQVLTDDGAGSVSWQNAGTSRVIKTARVTTATVPSGGRITTTITWGSPFSSNAYTVTATVEFEADGFIVNAVTNVLSGSVDVITTNNSGSEATAVINVIAIHD